jgi:AcrR family transcriptional regulator
MRLSKARREAVTAVMKDTIYQAAGSVLEHHGVSGMTMDRVATMAGLAPASLYGYFRNKGDLMQFVYDRLVEPFFQAIEETSKSDLTAPLKLKNIIHIARDSTIKNKGLIQFLAGEDQSGQIRRDTRPRFQRILAAIFEQGIRDGSFRSHNPAHASRVFQGCLSELFELQGDGATTEEVNEFVGVLIDAALSPFSVRSEKAPSLDETRSRPSNP